MLKVVGEFENESKMPELIHLSGFVEKTRGSDVTSYYQGRASPYRIGWNRILVALVA